MCTREMTLGEEIISLTEKGVDIPTVERMYRKYINLSANKEATKACEDYCKADAEIIAEILAPCLEPARFFRMTLPSVIRLRFL